MEGAHFERIVGHLSRGDIEKAKTQIDRMLEMLKDPRLVDSLKGVFTVSTAQTEEIRRAQRILERIREAI